MCGIFSLLFLFLGLFLVSGRGSSDRWGQHGEVVGEVGVVVCGVTEAGGRVARRTDEPAAARAHFGVRRVGVPFQSTLSRPLLSLFVHHDY